MRRHLDGDWGIQDMKSIVTGGAGFIGSHLVDRLVADGHDVLAIDNLSSGRTSNLNAETRLEEVDISDDRVASLVAAFKPDLVFHAAAQISVSLSAREPVTDARTNIMGTLNVLDAIRNAPGGPAKFVFVSSGGAMYGEPEYLPAQETLPANPASPYGASKRSIEVYLPVYKHLFGMRHTTLRLANVYGPRQDPHGEAGVVAIFSKAMLAGKPVTIFGDGNDERDYVFVGDVADALIRSASSEGEGPYNVGTGVGTNVNTLFGMLAELSGYGMTAKYGPPRAGDIGKISLDSAKLSRDTGWSASTRLIDGLAQTVVWFRENS
jgi:UDP-glucose 4-epimerase